MLKLQHINKSFSSKTVFDDTEFIANQNELTILIGPSGAGKTTLFNIILNIENCEYSFNNEDISSLDKKGKENFILDNISYASQKPTFIADLKMSDQIDLLKQIYSNDNDVSELISLFELEKLLDCYPNQLSGGEKSRFAFILALIKPAGIYMFDEPTSALDDIQASHIVAVLNDLKNKGNIVIISTHDHRLIEQGDKVYRIEDKKLHLLKTGERKLSQETEKKENRICKLTDVNHILSKMKKHHKLYNTLMRSLLALGIVIAMCGIEVGILVKYNFDIYTENKTSDILLINKQYEVNKYMNQNTGIPIEEKEVNKIRNTKHIKNMYPFLSYELSYQTILKNKTYISNKDKVDFDHKNDHKFDLVLILNDEKQNVRLSYEQSNEGSFTTYPEQINFEDKILEEWNDEGLYISYDFYETYVKPMIKKDEDKKNIRIKYPLTVPVYTSQGHIIGEGNKLLGFYLETDMKIKGVMKGDNIIDVPYDITNFNFSLSNKEMQKYIEKYKVYESHKCFFYMDLNKTICDEPVNNYIKNYDAHSAVYNKF